jgi:thiol peroxidase
MRERTGLVTMKGKPVTLYGNEVKAGDKAPEFTVVDTALQPVGLSTYRGKVIVIASVPSLDTGVCDAETRRFNTEAAALGVDRVITLSDYQTASFGEAYGVLIKGLRLLGRAVFVIDKNGIVRSVQLVPEIGSEPDYDAVLTSVRELM